MLYVSVMPPYEQTEQTSTSQISWNAIHISMEYTIGNTDIYVYILCNTHIYFQNKKAIYPMIYHNTLNIFEPAYQVSDLTTQIKR